MASGRGAEHWAAILPSPGAYQSPWILTLLLIAFLKESVCEIWILDFESGGLPTPESRWNLESKMLCWTMESRMEWIESRQMSLCMHPLVSLFRVLWIVLNTKGQIKLSVCFYFIRFFVVLPIFFLFFARSQFKTQHLTSAKRYLNCPFPPRSQIASLLIPLASLADNFLSAQSEQSCSRFKSYPLRSTFA